MEKAFDAHSMAQNTASKYPTRWRDASYSIYLTHIFTLGGLHAVWSRMVPTASMASSIALIAVSLTICAAVGWACYWLVEKPLTMWLQGSRSARSGSALSSANSASGNN